MIPLQGFIQDFLLLLGGRGRLRHVGDFGACPTEIKPLDIIELELTNFDSTSAIFKTLYNLALNKFKYFFLGGGGGGEGGRFGLWGGGGISQGSPPV